MRALYLFFLFAFFYGNLYSQPHSSTYPNGQIKDEGRLKNGQKEGTWIHWSEDGHKQYEYHYHKGKKHGQYTRWFPSGQIAEQSIYSGGRKSGNHMVFQDDGTIHVQGKYKNGLREGSWTFHSEEKVELGQFSHGEKEGTWLGLTPDSLVSDSGSFHHGKKDGEWHYHNYVEHLLTVGHFDEGKKVGNWTSWYENGSKASESHYEGGFLHGRFTEWYANGNKKVEGKTEYGAPVGTKTTWYQNGAKHEEFHYQKFWDTHGCNPCAKENGIFFSWYDSGRLAIQGHYKFGLKDGYWVYYYPNGNKEKEENWKVQETKNNTLRDYRITKHGRFSFYNKKEELQKVENYEEDTLVNLEE